MSALAIRQFATATANTPRTQWGMVMGRKAIRRVRTTVARMAPVVTLNRQDAKEVFKAVVLAFDPAQLARAGNKTKECARLWKQGRRFPDGQSLINIARGLPTVKAWLYNEIERDDVTFESDRSLTGTYQQIVTLASTPGKEGDAARQMLRDMARMAAQGNGGKPC